MDTCTHSVLYNASLTRQFHSPCSFMSAHFAFRLIHLLVTCKLAELINSRNLHQKKEEKEMPLVPATALKSVRNTAYHNTYLQVQTTHTSLQFKRTAPHQLCSTHTCTKQPSVYTHSVTIHTHTPTPSSTPQCSPSTPTPYPTPPPPNLLY